MSTVETAELLVRHEVDEHDHPKDKLYIQVAIVLAVLTALEVSTYWLEDELGDLLLPMLFVLMVIKFALVALFFMHLRFDAKVFGRVFWAGAALAILVYIVALAALHAFA